MNTSRIKDRVDEGVEKAVLRVLKARLGHLGFQRAEVHAGEDHNGEPALFVDAQYNLSHDPIDPGATLGLLQVLRRELEAVGETRFPHVRHHFDERQRVASSS